MSHTSGLWQWETLPGGRWVLTGGPAPTPVVLTVDKDEFGPLTDPEANRRLIAAAPAMAEQLLWIYENLHPRVLGRPCIDTELIAMGRATKVLREAGVIPTPELTEAAQRVAEEASLSAKWNL